MLPRFVLAAAAVLVLAWLAVMWRDQRLLARGDQALAAITAPGRAAQAESRYRAARWLNPDPTADLRLVLVYRFTGQAQRAVAAARAVARREPDNLAAWAALFAAAKGDDPQAVREAVAARRRLDPLDAGA